MPIGIYLLLPISIGIIGLLYIANRYNSRINFHIKTLIYIETKNFQPQIQRLISINL
jgi:hypothetical protein